MTNEQMQTLANQILADCSANSEVDLSKYDYLFNQLQVSKVDNGYIGLYDKLTALVRAH